MNVTYIIPHGIYKNGVSGIEIGIQNKLDAQIKALSMNNVNVTQLYLPLYFTSPLSFVRSYKNAFRTLSGLYSNPSDEYIYIRSLAPHTINYMLSFKKKNTKIIYEVQDTGIYIFKNQGIFRKLQVIYLNSMEYLLSGRIVRNAFALVSVTQEISAHYKYKANNQSLHHLINGNGIDTAKHPIRRIPNISSLHILCVANVNAWHGIDRFIYGLHKYESTPDKRNIVLHIVGNGPELPHLKEVITELNLQDNVIFHGYKSGKELDEMFDMCHIALDALAGFRRELTELSSLKSREYCARGIPFIASSKDVDFPDGWEYIQKIPDDETPVDMNTVIDFANRVMSDPEHPQKMRKYAEENLDWMAKMKVLKEFLESL